MKRHSLVFAFSICDSAYLTFSSSFSSSSALMSSGPRTAYSILRRLMKTLSSVRTLPHGLTAALAAMPRHGVIICWSSAEDTGPPSVIPTPLPNSAPPALCLVIIVVVVVAVMVFVGQPPAITALRKRACDIIRVSTNPPFLSPLISLPFLPRRPSSYYSTISSWRWLFFSFFYLIAWSSLICGSARGEST